MLPFFSSNLSILGGYSSDIVICSLGLDRKSAMVFLQIQVSLLLGRFFPPKCCVLWCFYESDVLGCWLFPFTDGGNIYSNWEPTYQLVDSWEKQQQQGAI